MIVWGVKNTPRITLELTVLDAQRLQGYVQNAICPPEDEDSETKEFRKELFNALKEALEHAY